MNHDSMQPSDDVVVADTIRWLERAVIGLNLCPFAKAVHVKGQVHTTVSQAQGRSAWRTLRDDLEREMQALHDTPPEVRDTTLLVLPHTLHDFHEFNAFLDEADAALRALDLEGELQIAPFHPHFQFDGTAPDDITNATNQSPYPTLHLIREASIDRAVAAFPEAEAIYEANIATLEKLGPAGWAALNVGPSPHPRDPDTPA